MKRNVLLLVLIVGTAFGLAACDKSNGKDKPGPSPKGESSRPMSKEVQAFFESQERGAKPGVVFVLYDNGRMQSFRREDQKPVEFERGQPVPADKILAMESIAIVRTSNPKYCWIDGTGTTKCVSW
jgi:hypothetical protein